MVPEGVTPQVGAGKAARPGVNSVRVRKVKGKKGVVKEQHDLIVNIDLVMTTSF